MPESLQETKPDQQFSILREELENLAIHDPVLKRLLRRRDLPTADMYVMSQWGEEPPEEMDYEEARCIEILAELEALQQKS